MNSIDVILIIFSVALMGLILIQQRGSDAGSIFGGSSEFLTKRRGTERLVFSLSIGCAVLFIVLSLARAFLPGA